MEYASDREKINRYFGRDTDLYPAYAAMGDFERALRGLILKEEHEKQVDVNRSAKDLAWLAPYKADRARLRECLTAHPRKVFDILHEWEENSVRQLGLEAHWRHEPFPGELL